MAIPTECIREAYWFNAGFDQKAWCEDTKIPGEHLCHNVIIKTAPGCEVIKVEK